MRTDAIPEDLKEHLRIHDEVGAHHTVRPAYPDPMDGRQGLFTELPEAYFQAAVPHSGQRPGVARRS